MYAACSPIVSMLRSSLLISPQNPVPSTATCSTTIITLFVIAALLRGSCLRITAIGSLPTTITSSIPISYPVRLYYTVASTHRRCNFCTFRLSFFLFRTSCRFSNALCSCSRLIPPQAHHLILITHARATQSIFLYS